MKISVSGCAGIGKTTLASQLAEKLDIPFIEENYEAFFDQPGKFNASPEELIKLFNQVLELKHKKENNLESFVTDRCPVDLLNLWLSKGLFQKEKAMQTFYNKCKRYAADYDFIIFPPWGGIPLEQLDNTRGYQRRILNSWVQLRNHAAILGIAHSWIDDNKIIQLPKKKSGEKQRLNHALKQIRNSHKKQ